MSKYASDPQFQCPMTGAWPIGGLYGSLEHVMVESTKLGLAVWGSIDGKMRPFADESAFARYVREVPRQRLAPVERVRVTVGGAPAPARGPYTDAEGRYRDMHTVAGNPLEPVVVVCRRCGVKADGRFRRPDQTVEDIRKQYATVDGWVIASGASWCCRRHHDLDLAARAPAQLEPVIRMPDASWNRAYASAHPDPRGPVIENREVPPNQPIATKPKRTR